MEKSELWRLYLPPHPVALKQDTDSINHRQLDEILLLEDEKFHATLASWGLLCASLPTCDKCGNQMRKNMWKTSGRGARFKCYYCGRTLSTLRGTFFARTKTSKRDILLFLYFFCRDDYNYKYLSHEMKKGDRPTFSYRTLADQIRYFFSLPFNSTICSIRTQDQGFLSPNSIRCLIWCVSSLSFCDISVQNLVFLHWHNIT